MRRRFRTLIVLASTFALVLVLSVGIASADPKNAFGPIEVDCGGGLTFDVLDQGNGQFVPGHIVGSTGKFIVFKFDNFNLSVEITPPGIIIPQLVDATFEKGGGNANPSPPGGIEHCSFVFDVVVEPGVRVFGDGDVWGFITPPRP